ncbi:MAG: NAD(P)-dependent oxidoreductase [Candidatus Heimdallarchaeota archaeon]
MRILITGAFGSLGLSTLNYLRKTKHHITCFVRKTRKSKRLARKFRDFKIIYGDIRNYNDVSLATNNQDLILHFAAIVPPRFNYETLEFSRGVNVNGTKNIVETIQKRSNSPALIFPSSVAVFGDVRDRGACILAPEEPTNPNEDDIYAQQKVEAELLISNSNLKWSIFRFGFMPNVSSLKFDPMMFDVPLDTNMEIIHVRDAALAIVNALEKIEIWGKILHIAGGINCRLTYKEFIGGMLEAMGIGSLPDQAFGDNDFHCAFFDTDFSQKLLNYQTNSYDDLIDEMKKNAGIIRYLAKAFRSIVKLYLLSKSPYYKRKRKK